MKRIHLLLIAASLGMMLSGCVVRARGGVHATYVEPELVYVSPGVQVVADYHEPVFYSEGAYWRFYGGVWYQSHYHSHGWVRVHRVPHYVARVDRPQTYVRYRGTVRHRPAPRQQGPVVRDHRRPAPVHVRQAPPPRGPVVRDHRTGGGGNATVKVKVKVKPKRDDHRDHRN